MRKIFMHSLIKNSFSIFRKTMRNLIIFLTFLNKIVFIDLSMLISTGMREYLKTELDVGFLYFSGALLSVCSITVSPLPPPN
jgi:hypothetical protein